MNAISIDLEDWWCNEYLLPHLGENLSKYELNDHLMESVEPVLSLFERTKTKATFFVLGSTAVRYPHLIDRIFDQGHEIACHGYSHTPLTRLSTLTFEKELEQCEEILGKYSLKGFRAPSFSLSNKTKWAIDSLVKYGYEYDSSIFPTWTPLYGSPKAPREMYRISSKNVDRIDNTSNFLEVPITVSRTPFFGFPCSGGFWLRLLPERLLVNQLVKINRVRPVIVYAHPWEANINSPKTDAGIFANFEANYSRDSVIHKLEKILNVMKFGRMKDLIDESQVNV